MYRLKFKDIPSFKFIIGKDFIVQMFRESRKNLPYYSITLGSNMLTALLESSVMYLLIKYPCYKTKKAFKIYILFGMYPLLKVIFFLLYVFFCHLLNTQSILGRKNIIIIKIFPYPIKNFWWKWNNKYFHITFGTISPQNVGCHRCHRCHR